ncbi:MAG TPA: hypothetical protein VMP67_04210 [Candidatus Limnocylindria bacterium]|nr:hypothetical protein [Candidatus Limnocylindria bacterium]
MQKVAIAELRRRPRHYLARMVAGEHFEVTAFGRPIADLGGLSYRTVPVGKSLPAGGEAVQIIISSTDLRD